MLFDSFLNGINVKKFMHDSKSKTFVAEASDLNGTAGEHRIYDDACDVGITLVNLETLGRATFYFHEEVHDGDGDLIFTEYLPISEHVRKNPRLEGYTVRIYND